MNGHGKRRLNPVNLGKSVWSKFSMLDRFRQIFLLGDSTVALPSLLRLLFVLNMEVRFLSLSSAGGTISLNDCKDPVIHL